MFFYLWCLVIIMVNFVYCGFLNFVYIRGRGVFLVGNYFYYLVWCDEWVIYFLLFCFNYFYVNVINFNDGIIRVIRCDWIFVMFILCGEIFSLWSFIDVINCFMFCFNINGWNGKDYECLMCLWCWFWWRKFILKNESYCFIFDFVFCK